MKPYETATYYYEDARDTYVSYKAAVGMPALTSFISGIAFGGLSTVFFKAMGWQINLWWNAVIAFVALIVTYILYKHWWMKVVTGIESAFMAAVFPNTAIDAIQVAVTPENKPIYATKYSGNVLDQLPANTQSAPIGNITDPAKIEIVHNKGRIGQRTTIQKLPASRLQLQAIARHVLFGGNINIRYLRSILLDDQITQEFYDKLIELDYARWRNRKYPKEGIVVTTLGWAVFQRASGLSNPPPPPGFVTLDEIQKGYNVDTHTNTQENAAEGAHTDD